jgi:rhodanese-related sulfurtransferase
MVINTIKYTLIFVLICISLPETVAQQNEAERAAFSEMVNSYLSYTVPVISVDDLHAMPASSRIILDAREIVEFKVSHIKGAIHIGFKHFDVGKLASVPKDKKIIVYCSIGYRSEKIGEKLIKLGFTRVYNLYGSLFEWVNRGFEVVDMESKPVKKIHGYDKSWAKWITNSSYSKVY